MEGCFVPAPEIERKLDRNVISLLRDLGLEEEGGRDRGREGGREGVRERGRE